MSEKRSNHIGATHTLAEVGARRSGRPIIPRSLRLSTGFTISLRDNTSAYGYSVTITGSYAILNSLANGSSVGDIFAAALGAVAAFTIIQACGLQLLRGLDEHASERTLLIARLMDVASVGAGMGCALVCGRLLSGPGAWFLGTFSASCIFVLMDSLEISLVKHKLE